MTTPPPGMDIVERLRIWSGACMTPAEAAQQGPYITELLRRAADEIERLRAAKDEAYNERNRLVALLANLYPSGIARTDIPGWDPEWHGCVYIDLPTGQASWHYHDREAHLFAHLPAYTKPWDGHTTEEKYARVARLRLAAPEWRDIETASLRSALEPFAKLGGPNDGVMPAYHDSPSDLVIYHNSGISITAGDVRDARRVLGWLHAPGWKEPQWGNPDGTCLDCPPPNYPTDETRCSPCPRRKQAAAVAGEDAASPENQPKERLP